MQRKPNETFSFTFHLVDAAGVPVNADSTPTGVFRTNGTDDGAVSITVTNVTTGEYKASGTVPIDYVAGDFCEVIILAVVGGDTIRQVVGTIDVDTSRASDLGVQLNTVQETVGVIESDLGELSADLASGGATLANQNLILNKVNSARIVSTSPVASNQTLSIVRGDDYDADEGLTLGWTVTDYLGPTVVDATCALKICTRDSYEAGSASALLTVAGSLSLVSTTLGITFELTAAQTAALDQSPIDDKWDYVYQVSITYADGHKTTKFLGAATVQGKIS